MWADSLPAGLLISRVLADLRSISAQRQPMQNCFNDETVPDDSRPLLEEDIHDPQTPRSTSEARRRDSPPG
jgi:hypothetical protein